MYILSLITERSSTLIVSVSVIVCERMRAAVTQWRSVIPLAWIRAMKMCVYTQGSIEPFVFSSVINKIIKTYEQKNFVISP